MKKFLPFCITTKRGIYRTSLNTSSFLQASRRTSLLQGIERTVSYRFNANNTIECGDGDFYATGTYTLNADGTLYLIEGNDQVDMTIEELTDTTLKASYLDWLEIVDGPPPRRCHSAPYLHSPIGFKAHSSLPSPPCRLLRVGFCYTRFAYRHALSADVATPHHLAPHTPPLPNLSAFSALLLPYQTLSIP